MIRYGKPSGPLLSHKQAFFTDNDRFVAEQRRLAAIYTAQPTRKRCKCCDGAIGAADFVKDGIGYAFCARCGHMNGVHEDTAAFCAALYTEDAGKQYAKHYSAGDREAYAKRVRDIYVPKADFLLDALGARETAAKLSYADFGAGAGYFVSALRSRGLNARGYEVSATMAGLAKEMSEPVTVHVLDDTATLAESVDADVISLIGVLEHLPDPRGVLDAIRRNRRIRYLYLSVPLFSPSVFIEMAFPKVMHRQLSGGHTHLYTEQSLGWVRKEFGFDLDSEWWFGTDLPDMYRSILVSLPESLRERWTNTFAPSIDAMQLALDQRHQSSEVHQLLRKA